MAIGLAAALCTAALFAWLAHPGAAATGNTATQATSVSAAYAAGTKRCHSSQLAIHVGAASGATGHIGQVVTFRNKSQTRCTLYGFPGMQMLGTTGKPIATHVHWGASYVVPPLAKRMVTLAQGGRASFEIGYEDGTGFGGAHCPKSTLVRVTPPNAYQAITVRWSLRPYGGSSIEHLQCGVINVSPVYAGRGEPPRG